MEDEFCIRHTGPSQPVIKAQAKAKGLSVEISNQDFALSLKTWRLRNNLTQVDAGKILGCSRYTIIRVERAKLTTWELTYRLFCRLAEELAKESGHALHNDH